MSDFASLTELQELWRPLDQSEQDKATALLSLVSNCLRYEADKVGKDLDEMIAENPLLADVAKSVTIDVVKRYMNDNKDDSISLSQMSESAGGYSVSGTYLVPGGGLFIKKTELQRLGLRRQKVGLLNYDFD